MLIQMYTYIPRLLPGIYCNAFKNLKQNYFRITRIMNFFMSIFNYICILYNYFNKDFCVCKLVSSMKDVLFVMYILHVLELYILYIFRNI